MDRRTILRAGVLAGLGVAFPGPKPGASVRWQHDPGTAVACAFPPTPLAVARSAAQVEEFSLPLRFPPVLAPTDADATTDVFDVEMREAEVEVIPGTTTSMWTYAGSFPGPTIVATRGREAVVRQHNQLPVPTTVHLHGGHVPPEHDGHPELLIAPGETFAYRYPNTQLAATLWYHDHRHHHTADAVYRGLAGLYLLTDPEEDALGLPSGTRDLPLVLTDRSFAEDGSLLHPPHDGSSFFGDTVLVNGVPHPYVEVEAARYRLRLLNGSNSRAYRLFLSDGTPMRRIASDGGLLRAPIETEILELWPAERVEVVVDLRGKAGTSIVLAETFGPWAGVLRFDVTADAPDDSRVPTTLRTIAPQPPPSVVREIVVDFDRRLGVWVLDGKPYDASRIDQFPKLGSTEVWRFTNVSEMAHPMHPHLVMFQVVGRNDGPPREGDEGWKDTVVVPPGEWVDVAMRFEDHVGRFVYHCHNLEHEDSDMMAQFRVVDLPRVAGDNRFATALAISRSAFTADVPVVFVATGRDFPDALAAGPAAAASQGAMLLTERDRLPASTIEALAELRPQRVVVLGGTGVVSREVEQELATRTGAPVDRVAGASRYETAAAISRTYAVTGSAVYVASGRGFADALAGGAAAAAHGASLLLTEPTELPAATATELQRVGPSRIVLLGGTTAVSRDVETALARYGPVERIAGSDRYETAAAVVADAFPIATEQVFVATGASFPDALAGTAALAGAPLLLVAPDDVPPATATQLRRLRPRRIVVLGGPSAVSLRAEDQLAAHLPDA